jgi:MYXO-CTERM domain-containing protein
MLGRVARASLVLVGFGVTLSNVALATPMRRTIYLNRNGGLYKAGAANDSGANITPLLPMGTRVIGPALLLDSEWQEVVQCVKDKFAPYSAKVTDVDPGTSAHLEIVFGNSTATEFFPPPDPMYEFYGVSPSPSCASGQPIDRAIGFVFTKQIQEALPTSYVKRMCEYGALLAGRSLTLDYEYDCTSVMSLREDCDPAVPRSFSTTAVPCGSTSARPCVCGGSAQSSRDGLNDTLGPFDDVPPTLTITEPADGATVQSGFVVKADADDETQLVKVEMWIDDVFATVDNFPKYELVAPANVAVGPHKIELRAVDNGDNTTTRTIMLTVQAECSTDAECSPFEKCTAGACLGDFGATCVMNTDCATGLCAEGPDGFVCTALCEGPDAITCPAGTVCQLAPGGGLDKCLPSEQGGCACKVGGGGGAGGRWAEWLAFAAMAAIGALGVRRRTSRDES